MSPPPKYMLFKYNVLQFFFVFLLTTHTYRVEIMLRWQISNSIFVTRTQTLNFWSRILSIITDSFCLLKDFILFFKTAVNIIWTRFWGSKPKLRNILQNCQCQCSKTQRKSEARLKISQCVILDWILYQSKTIVRKIILTISKIWTWNTLSNSTVSISIPLN